MSRNRPKTLPVRQLRLLINSYLQSSDSFGLPGLVGLVIRQVRPIYWQISTRKNVQESRSILDLLAAVRYIVVVVEVLQNASSLPEELQSVVPATELRRFDVLDLGKLHSPAESALGLSSVRSIWVQRAIFSSPTPVPSPELKQVLKCQP